MTGLDTNVLVRYIMQDDPRQSPMATSLVESLDAESPGFVSLVTVVELYWVLTSCFELTGAQAAKALDAMIRTKQLVVERADLVMRALRIFGAGKADFADCLIISSALAAGCQQTMTFDIAAAKYAGLTLVA